MLYAKLVRSQKEIVEIISGQNLKIFLVGTPTWDLPRIQLY
jgi:hypothetical protein